MHHFLNLADEFERANRIEAFKDAMQCALQTKIISDRLWEEWNASR